MSTWVRYEYYPYSYSCSYYLFPTKEMMADYCVGERREFPLFHPSSSEGLFLLSVFSVFNAFYGTVRYLRKLDVYILCDVRHCDSWYKIVSIMGNEKIFTPK